MSGTRGSENGLNGAPGNSKCVLHLTQLRRRCELLLHLLPIGALLICVLLSVTLVACINPFRSATDGSDKNEATDDTGDGGHGEDIRYGTIVINPGQSMQASTIMPDLGNLGELAHRRQVEFTHTGPGTPGSLSRDPVESYQDGDPIADIPYGTWTVTMFCYDESEELIATGTTPGVVVDAATVPVTVLITPLAGGSGTLVYTVEFPAELVTEAVVTLDPWPIGGDDEFVLVPGVDPAVSGEVDYNEDFAATGLLSLHATLPSGAYLMTIQLSDTAASGDGLHAPLVEIVQIYDNLTSSAPPVVLTEAQLRSVPDAPSNLQIIRVGPDAELATLELFWTDNSNTEMGFRVYRNSVLIGQVGSGITTYLDTNVSFGTYSYTVAAYNNFGNSPDTGAVAAVVLLAYEGNESTGGAAPATVAYLDGETVIVAGQGDLVREGHTFEGWNTQLDGSGTDYAPGVPFTITGNTTLHAQWEIITYTLTYTAGPGGSILGATVQTVDHGADGTQVTANPSTDYQFVRWSDGSTDNPRQDTVVTGDITVTAAFARPFVFTVRTDNVGGLTGPNQYQIQVGTGEFNYTVYWGDGQSDTGVTGNITHTYAAAGEYDISIVGQFPHMQFPVNVADGDAPKVVDVRAWGDNQWQSMVDMFRNCSNLAGFSALDAPNLTNVTSMSGMFRMAAQFNGTINHWNVSTVTDMSYLFYGDVFTDMIFNQPLNNWDVGSVTTMMSMFDNNINFNQDITGWDVHNVTTMSSMFNRARSFNQPIGVWQTDSLWHMGSTFAYTDAFNQPLNSWNVSGVQWMTATFNGSSYNQPLDLWDVSNVTSMSWMFSGTSVVFNQDISGWDVSSVTNMSNMFFNSSEFNQDITGWNVSSVTNMSRMFQGAHTFDQNLGLWDISSVTNMTNMLDTANTTQGLSPANYSSTLIGWEANPTTPNGITLGAASRQYNPSGATARNSLITTHGWAIEGDEPQPW